MDTLNQKNDPTNFCGGFKHIHNFLMLFLLMWDLCTLSVNMD